MTMTVHNYRPRQFHRTSNGENPSSGYRDMGSASLAAARPAARPPARPPARTVTTIPLQPGGLRGKKRSTQRARIARDSFAKWILLPLVSFLRLTHWPLGDVEVIFRIVTSENKLQIVFMSTSCENASNSKSLLYQRPTTSQVNATEHLWW